MKTPLIALLAAALIGCGGSNSAELFGNDTPQQDAAPTADAAPDTQVETDSAPPDAATEDATPDAGQDAQAEAGDDAAPDALIEAGQDADAAPDAFVEAGDAATEAGQDAATDALAEAGDAATDALSEAGDAASDAPLACTLQGQHLCNGDQPMLCNGSIWTTNGGTCALGCDQTVGLCSCDVGTAMHRYTDIILNPCPLPFPQTCPGIIYRGLADSVTGLVWYAGGQTDYPTALNGEGKSPLTGITMRLPTVAEVQDEMLQNPNVSCSDMSFMPAMGRKGMFGGDLVYKGAFWTSDSVGSNLATVDNVTGLVTYTTDTTAWHYTWYIVVP